jgi:uncharacterized cupin superfamily protein
MADWFVVNVADAQAQEYEKSGSWVRFEDPDERFPDFGINIHVLQPGQPNCKYHHEDQQEDFLVLAGECIAIVDDEEHRLRTWDFLHCPPGTPHVFIGAGDGPCAILMVGARKPDEEVQYPVSEVAAKYGASVSQPTDSPEEAYADWGRDYTETRLSWPPA